MTVEQMHSADCLFPPPYEESETAHTSLAYFPPTNSGEMQQKAKTHPPYRRKHTQEKRFPHKRISHFEKFSTDDHNFKSRWKSRYSLALPNSRSAPCLFVVLWLLLLSLFSLPVKSQVSTNTFGMWENEISMDEDRRYVVQWTPTPDRILFRITAKTRGYIGFGFHSKPRMKGADIVVG